MRYLYRLESPWADWASFFCHPLCYTGARPIDGLDEIEGLEARPGGVWCGLWMLGDWADARRFHSLEPLDPDGKGPENSLNRLLGIDHRHPMMRFATRIDADAFHGEALRPDELLTGVYPSACFHPRWLKLLGRNLSSPGELMRDVTIDDRHVEVQFDGHWLRKSPDLGLWLLNKARERGDLTSFIPQ